MTDRTPIHRRIGRWLRRWTIGTSAPGPADLGRAANELGRHATRPIARDTAREGEMAEDFDHYLAWLGGYTRDDLPRLRERAQRGALILGGGMALLIGLAGIHVAAYGSWWLAGVTLVLAGACASAMTMYYYTWSVLAREHYVPFLAWLRGNR